MENRYDQPSTTASFKTDTSVIEIIDLHPREMELIKSIRHRWRFGEIVIKVRNGLPFRLVRTQEFIDLST